MKLLGKVIDVYKARAGVVSTEDMGELSHAHVGEVDTAAGDADVAREHGKRVNQADGEAAVDVALETEAAPDVHGGVCGDETCQKFHGSRRLVDGVAEFGRIYLAYSGQQFLLTADFFLVKMERTAPVEDLQQQFDEQFRGLPIDEMDHERYQSVFARNEGAVAAPAASLHFSKQLLKRMEIGGFEFAFMTSHMSLGNFRPVDVEDLTKFKSDSERIIIPQQCVDIVEKARETEHHVCAVGTEIMRALEHVAGTGGHIKPYDGWTNKFLYPPYSFSAADSFFVNLYMPMSSQQLMVAAFGGFEEVMNAYNVAVQEGYRFGDYGDSMLIID